MNGERPLTVRTFDKSLTVRPARPTSDERSELEATIQRIKNTAETTVDSKRRKAASAMSSDWSYENGCQYSLGWPPMDPSSEFHALDTPEITSRNLSGTSRWRQRIDLSETPEHFFIKVDAPVRFST
jgi:hypothetical protein